MYKIQTAKYGTDWEDADWIEPCSTLEKAIEICNNQETHEKFHFRVVIFPSNEVKYTVTIPYEGRHINLIDDNYVWFDEIMADYGIPKELIHKSILHWLHTHIAPCGMW